jgi:hypothetical protein
MSIILDALKKLEQKRQKGPVPDLMTVHAPEPQEPKKRPLWPYLVLAALILNAGILAAVFRPWESDEQAVIVESISDQQSGPLAVEPEQEDIATGEAVANAPVTREENVITTPKTDDRKPVTHSDMATEETKTDTSTNRSDDLPQAKVENQSESIKEDNVPGEDGVKDEQSVSDEAAASADFSMSIEELEALRKMKEDNVPGKDGVEDEQSVSDEAAASPDFNISIAELEALRKKIKAERSLQGQDDPIVSGSIQGRDAPTVSEPVEGADAVSGETVIELSQLPSEIKKELPDISISGHIFSDNPASRMANINGSIVREGENVARGLMVDEITLSGVIFSYQGFRFRVRAF